MSKIHSRKFKNILKIKQCFSVCFQVLWKGIIQDGTLIKMQSLPEVAQSGGSRLVEEEAISSWHSFAKSSLGKRLPFSLGA